MKRGFITVTLLLLFSIGLRAQITLNMSAFPSLLTGKDSLKISAYSDTLPSFAPAANGIWDLSGITDSTPVLFSNRLPSSTYSYLDSIVYSYHGNPYVGYKMSSVISLGLQEYGEQFKKYAFSIYFLTAGASDSLYIDSQTVTYSSPFTELLFPATYGSSWTSTYFSDFTVHITVALSSMNMQHGILRKHTTVSDSIIGWGQMKVKDANGNPSDYFNVLQLQRTIYHLDSVLMDSPINDYQAAIILYQNSAVQKDTTYQQFFYRTGEIVPFATVNFWDATYNKPKNIKTHTQHMVNFVPELSNVAAFNLFPNPTENNMLHICFPFEGTWHLAVTDLLGNTVFISDRFFNKGNNELILPDKITNGIYSITCCNASNFKFCHKFEIRR